MTGDAHPGTRLLGSLRSADGAGVVRIEDRHDTDIGDLWSALTDPGRLARWYGQVEGDLRLGGELRLCLEPDGWDGASPRRLLVALPSGLLPDVRRAVATLPGGRLRRSGGLTWSLAVERMTGIEPAWPAWKAGALPLSYIRAASMVPCPAPQQRLQRGCAETVLERSGRADRSPPGGTG